MFCYLAVSRFKILTLQARTASIYFFLVRKKRQKEKKITVAVYTHGKIVRWRWFQQGPVAIGLPLKQHPLSPKTSIVAALLCAAKTHYNSLRHSHGEHRFSAPRSTTPGRCKVAAIFYYKDNLIHIAAGGLRGSCCSPRAGTGVLNIFRGSILLLLRQKKNKRKRCDCCARCNLLICILWNLRVCV